MIEFGQLGLSKEFLDTLESNAIQKPTEIQEKTIPLAMAGKDIIGGSATGSGKTLAFAAPIIEKFKPTGHVQTLVLTPTRELAEQVADSFKKFSKNKKIKILAVYGGVNIAPQIKRLADADVVVGTPGRILDHLNRKTLTLRKIKFLVLDEVDRMFDMGFYQDVETILAKCSTERQTMMFSATISADIDYLAQKYTKNPEEVEVKSYVGHSKLKQVYYDVPDNKKFSLFVYLLKKEKSNLIMVFCSTRKNADFLARNLSKLKINAKAIHGGMLQNKRKKVLDEFHGKGVSVLICTDVAARGLDIKGVSHVYNYDLPSDSRDYIHRIGRTARAGEKGKAINILASRDYENFGNILVNKSLDIQLQELPKFERVMIRMAGDSHRRVGYKRPGRGPRKTGRRPIQGRYGSRNGRGSSRDRKPHRGRDSYRKPRGKSNYSGHR